MARIDTLRELLTQDPANSRVRFMLGMEHMSAGDWAQARAEFDRLLASDAGYLAAYYQAGRVCEQMEDVEAARNWYERGVAAARAAGDGHAVSELQAALDLLG